MDSIFLSPKNIKLSSKDRIYIFSKLRIYNHLCLTGSHNLLDNLQTYDMYVWKKRTVIQNKITNTESIYNFIFIYILTHIIALYYTGLVFYILVGGGCTTPPPLYVLMDTSYYHSCISCISGCELLVQCRSMCRLRLSTLGWLRGLRRSEDVVWYQDLLARTKKCVQNSALIFYESHSMDYIVLAIPI